jgi:hypothetical protein
MQNKTAEMNAQKHAEVNDQRKTAEVNAQKHVKVMHRKNC